MISSIPSIRDVSSRVACVTISRTSVTVPRWLGLTAMIRARTRAPASARSPTQSIALCRTNSSGQRSDESTSPVSSSTIAFAVDAPRINPIRSQHLDLAHEAERPRPRELAPECVARHADIQGFAAR